MTSRHRSEANEPLTPHQVCNYLCDGFVVLDTPQISDPELGDCRDILLEMMQHGTGRREGRNLDLIALGSGGAKVLPTVLQPSLYEPRLRSLSIRRIGQEIARQLLGPTARFADDHAIYKPSHRGGITHWHQDEAFREPGLTYHELSIWVALLDTTVENGAMAYIPGSHRLGLLPHRLPNGAKDGNTLECCGGFDQTLAAVRPIRAGAMIIHHPRTIHGAGENNSRHPRLGYILVYRTPVRMSRELRKAPWLKDLRTGVRKERSSALWRGGVFAEIQRVLRSERRSGVYLWRRGVNRLRRLFKAT